MSHHPSNVHANESLVATPAVPTRGLAALVPWIAGVLALGMMLAVVAKGLRPIDQGGLPIDEIARLPVSASGRTKPLDSFARASLLRLSGRQSFEADGGRQAPAIEWLLELWTNRDKAVDRRVIRIDHPEVVTLAVGKPAEARQTRFTVREILPAFPAIAKQAEQASQRPAKSRDLFERQVLELYNKLTDFSAIANFDAPYSVAPLAAGQEWKPLSLAAGPGGHGTDEASTKLMAILSSYAEGNAEAARAATRDYAATLEEAVPSDAHAARSEVLFNRVEPFYQASTLYVLAFILGGVSLLMRPISPLKWSPAFARATLAVVGVAFLVHTVGLFARIYLQGRPPVTNLYSSAVFIGWACVPLAIAGEWFQRHGLLTLVASLIGFSTLVIAHNLGRLGRHDGDDASRARFQLLARHARRGRDDRLLGDVSRRVHRRALRARGRAHAAAGRRAFQGPAAHDLWRDLLCHDHELRGHGARGHLGRPIVGPLLGVGS
jgi:hypothetical protein